MYVNSISNANSLPVTNPQFKKGGKFLQAVKNTVSPVYKPTANALRAIFVGGALALGATSCTNYTEPTQQINETALTEHSDLTLAEFNACVKTLTTCLTRDLYAIDGPRSPFFFKGISYNKKDSTASIVMSVLGNLERRAVYDKETRSFQCERVAGNPCVYLTKHDNGSMSVKYVSPFSMANMEYTADGKLLNTTQKNENKLGNSSERTTVITRPKTKKSTNAVGLMIAYALSLLIGTVGSAIAMVKYGGLCSSSTEYSEPVRKHKKGDWEPFYIKWLYGLSDWLDEKYPDDTHYMDGL